MQSLAIWIVICLAGHWYFKRRDQTLAKVCFALGMMLLIIFVPAAIALLIEFLFK